MSYPEIIRFETAWNDWRGDITNILPPGYQVSNIAIITSRAGSMRSGHYHKKSSHWCYVVEGFMWYHYRPVGSSDPPERALINKGQAVFTPPEVEHLMHFPDNTVFLSISDEPQYHEAHEEDLVRCPIPLTKH